LQECHSEATAFSIARTIVGSARQRPSTGLNDETAGNGLEESGQEGARSVSKEIVTGALLYPAFSGHFRQFRCSGQLIIA
jgi:hypothetical protein